MFHVYLKLLFYRLEPFLKKPWFFLLESGNQKKKNPSVRFAHFYQEVIVVGPLSEQGKSGNLFQKKRGREALLVAILINFQFIPSVFHHGKNIFKIFFLLQTKETTYILLFLASLFLLILYWKSLHSTCNDLPQSFQVDNLFYQSSKDGLLCCSLIFPLQNCHIEKRCTYVVSYRWRSIFRVNSQNWHCWVGGKGIARCSQIPFHEDW